MKKATVARAFYFLKGKPLKKRLATQPDEGIGGYNIYIS